MTGKLVRSSNDGLKYMADLRSGRIDEKMDHLVRGVLRCGAGKDGVCVYACFVCVRILLCVHVRVRRYCVCVCVCAVSIIDSAYKSPLSVLCGRRAFLEGCLS